MERLRIELPCREFTFFRKRFRVWFFLHVKCADTCLFVYRCAISDEFFLLFAALQSHVGPQQTINQLPLLILSAETTGSGQEQHRGCQQFYHEARLPKLRCVCKANCESWPLTLHLLPPRCVEAFWQVAIGTATQRRGYNVHIIRRGLGFLLYSTTSSGNNWRMSDHVYKKIELVGSSPNGFEDAIKNALARAEKTVRNMRWFEVTETRGDVENGKVGHWQVTLKIGFTLEK